MLDSTPGLLEKSTEVEGLLKPGYERSFHRLEEIWLSYEISSRLGPPSLSSSHLQEIGLCTGSPAVCLAGLVHLKVRPAACPVQTLLGPDPH